MFISWTANGSTTPVWGNDQIVITDIQPGLRFTYPSAFGNDYTYSYILHDKVLSYNEYGNPIYLAFVLLQHLKGKSTPLDITFKNLPDKVFRYELIVK